MDKFMDILMWVGLVLMIVGVTLQAIALVVMVVMM